MKAICLSAVTAAALVLAAPAVAKEPLSATVCGASECRTITDRQQLNEIPGGETTVPLRRSAPYYRIDVVVGEPDGAKHTFTTYYVPSANAMAFRESGTVALHPIYGERATRAMRKLVAGIEPFVEPALTADLVAARGPDPSSAGGGGSRRGWALGLVLVGAVALGGLARFARSR